MKEALKTGTLSLAIIAALAVTQADAASEGARTGADFETLDTDGDGQLTQDELAAAGMARFARADTNGDGKLTADELTARMSQTNSERAAKMIERLDTNGDGAITQDEMTARRDPSRMFARLDKDSSGSISAEEFEAAKARMGARGGKRKKQADN